MWGEKRGVRSVDTPSRTTQLGFGRTHTLENDSLEALHDTRDNAMALPIHTRPGGAKIPSELSALLTAASRFFGPLGAQIRKASLEALLF